MNELLITLHLEVVILDLRIKMPLIFKDKEMEIRQLVTTHVERGKVELNITVTGSEHTIEAPSIDPVLFRKYVRELQVSGQESDQRISGMCNR